MTTTTSAPTAAPAVTELPLEPPRAAAAPAGCRTAWCSRPPSLLALALGYPLVRQVVLSFQEFGLAQQFGRPPDWVGLDNYRALVTDPYLWKVAAPHGRVLPGQRRGDDGASAWASRC